MRCRQTEKDIGELINLLANQQNGKLATGISQQNSGGNKSETAQLHCESMRSLPSHNNKENLIATRGNLSLINLRIWKKIPVLYITTHAVKCIVLMTNFQETEDLTP